MWNQRPCFRFEMDNFSEKGAAAIPSKIFVSGGCEWFLLVHPKGDVADHDHLSLYLRVANSITLQTGWKRSAKFYFVVLNQSHKELHRTNLERGCALFCAEAPSYGSQKTLPLSKFQEKGFLENDRLIIEVYINVVEAVDGEGIDVLEKRETVDINGFKVFASQVTPVRKIFAEHPNIAEEFKPKNQVVKTAYMNVLLDLINTINKPPHSHSETELSNAYNELSELTDAGFKLDWLRSKLEEVSWGRKKADDQVQQLQERVKNLELMVSDLKVELAKEKANSTPGTRQES